MPPKSRKTHLFAMLETLGRGLDQPEPGDAAAALHDLARSVRRRGMTVIISDLLTAGTDEVLKSVEHLAWRGQDVLVLQVLDPGELSPKLSAGQLLRDPETGREYQVDGFGAVRCRRAVEEMLAAYRARFRDLGVDYAVVSTEAPFDRALAAFLATRRWRRRGAGGRRGA